MTVRRRKPLKAQIQSTLGRRLESAIREFGLNKNQLAIKLGIAPSFVGAGVPKAFSEAYCFHCVRICVIQTSLDMDEIDLDQQLKWRRFQLSDASAQAFRARMRSGQRRSLDGWS